MITMTKAKPKKCKVCKARFIPRSTMQKVCGVQCAIALNKQNANKAFKKETAQRKAKLKTLSEWLSEAQTEFNAFIRVRDHHQPCISCGRHHTGQYHAGHYRTVKAASQLRFNPFNVHKQCSACNSHLSGNIVEYRINLCEKIGAKKLKELECNNDQVRYTIEQAKRIKRIFRKRTRLYKKLKGIA